MYKIKSRALSETAVINAEIQTPMAMVKNIDKDHIYPIDSLNKEVEIIRT